MKANELQIDDFIIVDGIVRKVCAITKHKIGYHKLELPFGECQMSYTRLYEVSPINLTPEILEKNGFEYDDSVNIVGKMISDSVYEKQFKYVHELQRALRLCGLNDLADNFKV